MTIQKTSLELDREKERAARVVSRWVNDGIHLGLGSGSTAAYFIHHVAERVRKRRFTRGWYCDFQGQIRGLPWLGIPTIEPVRGLQIDLTVDGADEIDPGLTLTKGGGGALLREKVIAATSRYVVIIGDSSKPVAKLDVFPAPRSCSVRCPLRDGPHRDPGRKSRPSYGKEHTRNEYKTDQGNVLIDCHFDEITDPGESFLHLRKMPGIVSMAFSSIWLERLSSLTERRKSLFFAGSAISTSRSFHLIAIVFVSLIITIYRPRKRLG